MEDDDQGQFLHGVTFLAIALVVGTLTLRSLTVGSLTRMGPGYFPMAISVVLFAIGLWLIVRSLLRDRERVLQPVRALAGEVEILPLLSISAALVIFVLTIDRLGIVLSVLLTCVTATIRKDPLPLPARLALGAVVAGLCALIFVVLIGMPLKILPF